MIFYEFKKILILFIWIIKVNSDFLVENAVSDIEIIDRGASFIELAWVNPLVDNNYLEFKYRIISSNNSNQVVKSIIDQDINSIRLDGFSPGSQIEYNISTIKNEKVIGFVKNLRAGTSKLEKKRVFL